MPGQAKLRLRASAALFGFLAVILVARGAGATHYGQACCTSGHPDSFDHVVWYGPTLTQTWINIVNWNRTNNIDPTVFNTVWTPSHDIADAAIGNAQLADAHGEMYCAVVYIADPNMCDHYHATYDHVDPLTLNQQRSVGCHELGHTLGLGHRFNNNNTSCMAVDQYFPLYLDIHDKDEVNSHLPPGYLNGDHIW